MSKSANMTATDIISLIRKQAYLCALSGRSLSPETASMDHIEPLARGGEHSLQNVWIVDQHVNAAKGTMTVDEFVAMCREVVAHQDAVDAEARGESAMVPSQA